MSHPKVEPKTTTFEKGTKIKTVTTNGDDSTTSLWTQLPDGTFKNQDGKIATYNQLFPNGIKLDVTNDGKFNKDDLTKLDEVDDVAGLLGSSISRNSSLHIKPAGTNVIVDKKNNSIQIVAYKKPEANPDPKAEPDYQDTDKNMSNISYTINLPKK